MLGPLENMEEGVLLKKLLLAAMMFCLAAPCGYAAQQQDKKAVQKRSPRQELRAEKPDVVSSKLEQFAGEHIKRLNRTLRPNKQHVVVTKEKDGYCAWYLQVDPATMKTQMRESPSTVCRYVGHIVYLEHRLVSYGKTKHEAMAGPFKEVKTLRKREIARYNEKQWRF